MPAAVARLANKARNGLTIRTALFAGIGVLAALLVVVTAQRLVEAMHGLDRAETAMMVADCADLLMDATADWAVERGLVFTALKDTTPISAGDRQRIDEKRRAAAATLQHIREHPERHRLLYNSEELLGALFQARAEVAALRRRADADLSRPLAERKLEPETWFRATTELIMTARRVSSALRSRLESATGLARTMALRDAAWLLSEFAGRERGLASGVIAGGRAATSGEITRIGTYRGWIAGTLQRVAKNRGDPDLEVDLRAAIGSVVQAYREDLPRLRKRAQPFLAGRRSEPAAAQRWFQGTTGVIEEAIDLQRVAMQVGREQARRQISQSRIQARVQASMVALAVLLGIASLLFVAHRVVRPIQRMTSAFTDLAAGRSDIQIPASSRGDEIGTMTRAILAFKATMIERHQLEEEVLARRQIEADLRRAKEDADAANLAKSRFLANVSHELRTPLNAVIGFAEALQHGYPGPLNDRQRGYVADIRDSGRHLLSLIEDVLDISKAESGDLAIQEEPVALAEAANQALAFVGEQAGARDVALDSDGVDADLCCHGDRRMIVQMLTNLLSNAIRCTPAGGRVRVAGHRRDGGGVRLAVEDTGVGMSETEIATAMELFGQVRKDAAEDDGGTGLGLPLVQRMASLHGAAMRIDSAPGEGTAVTLDFPAERDCFQ